MCFGLGDAFAGIVSVAALGSPVLVLDSLTSLELAVCSFNICICKTKLGMVSFYECKRREISFLSFSSIGVRLIYGGCASQGCVLYKRSSLLVRFCNLRSSAISNQQTIKKEE